MKQKEPYKEAYLALVKFITYAMNTHEKEMTQIAKEYLETKK